MSAPRPAPRPLTGTRSLLTSFGALASGETVARLLGGVAVIVMTRVLTPDGFGLVTLGTALVMGFAMIAGAGTEMLNVSDVSRDPQRLRKIAEPVLALRLVASLAVSAVFVIGVLALIPSSSSDRVTLALFAVALPAMALNLRWAVLGIGASRWVGAGNVAGQLLLLVGVLLFVRARHDTYVVALLQGGAELLYALVVLVAVARRFGLPRPHVDLVAWRATLRRSLPLMVQNVARTALYTADIMLIAILLDRTDVGYYGAAYKPVLFASGLVGLFATAFLASYSAASSRQDRIDLFARALRLSLAGMLAVAVAISVTAGVIVAVLFGHAYAPATSALAILVWTLPVLAVQGLYGNSLIAGEQQVVLMKHNVVGAVLNIAANLVVVPLFGIDGAAVVTVASLLVVLGLNYRSAVELGVAPSLRDALQEGRSDAALAGG